jgi:YbgC/YbaW family acyl-CoA thioester hydrolase
MTEPELNRRPHAIDRIRFSDCDPFGHLYNVRYLDYLFDAREEHVVETYPLLHEALQSRQTNWLIVSTDIRYAQAAKLGETVRIESSVLHFTRHFVQLEIAMLGQDGLKAVLWSGLRHVDLIRGTITHHKDEIQTFLERVVLPCTAANIDERVRQLRMASRSLTA